MKRLDRAATAALSLTGVVVATAVGVAFTAAARSPEPPAAESADRTIALVSPRATSAPPDGVALEPSVPGAVSARLSAAAGAPPASASRNRSAAAADTRGDGTPADTATGNPAGDTRGDGTPEDGAESHDDSRSGSGSDDDGDSSGHGGDDGAKSNSGPGNYEHPRGDDD